MTLGLVISDTIIKAASLVTALGVFVGLFWKVFKLLEKQKEQDKRLKDIEDREKKDIDRINDEQCLITYGVLACLKGLKEQGCNGPVTEAINKIEKHLNEAAHDNNND